MIFHSPGAELVVDERARQVRDELYTSDHDDRLRLEELARAAACYAMPLGLRQTVIWISELQRLVWPWPYGGLKPLCSLDIRDPREARANLEHVNNRIRELAKAGALTIAEIDKLIRLKEESR